MFRSRKKIRDLDQMLNAKEQAPEVAELLKAIETQKPAQASHKFANELKSKLLEKHQSMQKSKKVKEEKFSLWSDFRFRGWATALAMLVLVVLGGIISYPMIPAPTVQGYLLKGGTREISVNAPFKITFSQLMTNSSVEKNFQIEPALEGKFDWKGNTLMYRPTTALKVGDTYKITIGKGAVSLLQKPLESEYSEFYAIVPAPKVLLMTPHNGSEAIPADAKINIMFDRPLTGLTTLEAGRENFPNIKIEPATPGRFKWLGTTTLQFIPEKLNLATNYKITVPAGTEVMDGGVTESEATASFETIRPDALSMISTDAQSDIYISPKSKFKLTFNQSVDLVSAAEMIKLHRTDGNENAVEQVNVRLYTSADWRAENQRALELTEMNQMEEIKVASGPAVEEIKPEVPSNEELAKSLIVEPVAAMKAGSNYFLEVKEGLKGAEGPLSTKTPRNFSFQVSGELKLQHSNSGQDNKESGVELAFPVFTYTNQLDLRSLRNKVTITPSAKDEKGAIVPANVTSYLYNAVHVDYDYQPATDYVITIAPGVQDIFGNTFNEASELKFRTGNYKPAMGLETGTDISVVDGTKPSQFYLRSTNISFADVKLKPLTRDEFTKYYDQGYLNYDNITINGDEGLWQGVLPIKLNENQRGHTAMNLDQLTGAKLQPGFYLLEVSNPNVKRTVCKYDWETTTPGCEEIVKVEKTIFMVSKSALAIKYSLGEMLVWATDLQKGEPIKGQKIAVFSPGKKEILSGETDQNGIAKIKLPETENYYSDYLVFGEKEGDLTFVHSTWSEGVAPWNFNINSEAKAPEYYAYVYTDRPIYRPDQEVFFKGIVRQEKDYKFKLPEAKKVKVTINDSMGNEIYAKELPIGDNGTFIGNLKLGAKINSGDYSVQAMLTDVKGPEWSRQFNASFKVYEYRKPEYRLDLTPDRKQYVNGETAKVEVNAGYFFGAPLPDAEVKWTLKAQDYYFILPEEMANKLAGSWFSFADEGYFCYWGCQSSSEVVSQGKTKTGSDGIAVISLPFNLNDKKISQIYTLETTVSDANNQSVANRVSIPVHKGNYYIGVRSQDYIVSTDKPAKIEVLTVGTDGKELPGKTLEVAVYERNWNTVKRKNVDGDYYFENSYDDKLLEKKSVTTADNGLGEVEFKLTKGGNYKVEATAKDNRGNVISSSTTVYVSSGEFINWGSENNDQIELVSDKMEYQIGDTAKILVKSPYRGVYALVTYEKDKVFDQKVVKLESNSQTIEIPITERFQPNAFVSVVLVKGNAYDAGLAEPKNGAADERQVASFKAGYVTLQVDTENKRLNLEISSDKPRYSPGEKVKLTVKSSDFAGKPVAADLSVAVVDESVLSLTESVTADLLNVFYRQRLLGVNFAETLTKAISRVNVQVEAGMKGGGGGDLAKRGVFKDTAHFEATLNTNADGLGELEFTLPDNLTTWQVMAIGISDDRREEKALVGSGKYSFLANKDILVRPVLPRFMTSGDQMKLGAIVHNYTEEAQTIKISLEGSGLELAEGHEKMLNVKAKGSEKAEWAIKVSPAKEAKLTFTAVANGGERGDSVEQILPVHESSIPEVVALSHIVSGEAKEIEKVWLPAGLNLNEGGLEIKAAATLAGSLNDGLKYLIAYPYGCSEQLASAILPNVALRRLINNGKFATEDLSIEQIDKNVQGGLQDLYKNQLPGGGFGLWINSQPSYYLTAYVTQTMYEAKLAGYAVDENVLNKAIAYLKGYANTEAVKDPAQAKSIANNRAYVLYVLSEIGQGDLALNNNLYDQRAELRLISKAYLAMSYQKLTAVKNDPVVAEKIAQLKKELENAALQTPRGVNFVEADLDYSLFDTNTRTTAVILKALNRFDDNNPLVPKIISALLKERKNGHFSTTQETAISLLALIEYLESSDELSPAYEAQIALNGQEVLTEKFTSENLFAEKEVNIALKDMLGNNLDNEISLQKVGAGRMYTDFNLKYYLPLDKQIPESEGLEVQQEYFAMEDTKLEKALNSINVGQNVHGRLTVIVPEDRHYVMVEDLLPAGLEGIDFNLKTSEQAIQGKGNPECYYDCTSWYFNHSEVKDDRIMYFADFLPKGVYEIDYYVRATSVGKFADLPAIAQETYYPEVFGRSAGKQFEVI